MLKVLLLANRQHLTSNAANKAEHKMSQFFPVSKNNMDILFPCKKMNRKLYLLHLYADCAISAQDKKGG